MKTQKRFRHVLKIAVLLLTVGFVYAAENVLRYEAQPNTSKMRIDGTSTIHDWSVEGTIIVGYFEADPSFFKDPAVAPKIKPKTEITIPVRTLKSSTTAMNNVMYEAMKQKEQPNIVYHLKEMSLKKGPAAGSNGPYLFDTAGDLAVSGVLRPNNMVVTMEKLEGNKLKFTGTNALKMTDFGIKPPAPALALGAIKTADDVKISFEWVITPSSGEKSP